MGGCVLYCLLTIITSTQMDNSGCYISFITAIYVSQHSLHHTHSPNSCYVHVLYMNIKNCMNNVYQLGSFPTMWERPETKNSCRDEEWRMYSYVLGSFSILSGLQKMVCILNSNVLWTAKQLLFSAETMHQHVKLIYICMYMYVHQASYANQSSALAHTHMLSYSPIFGTGTCTYSIHLAKVRLHIFKLIKPCLCSAKVANVYTCSSTCSVPGCRMLATLGFSA